MKLLNFPAVVLLLSVSSAHVVVGQEPEPPAAPVEASGPAAEDSAEPRVVIHGYFSQAYANSSGHQLVGIPDDGTFDYRRMAILFRGNIGAKDTLVVQLAQRRLGESPVMQIEPDVKVDWAFYEHRFGGGTSVRLGRIPTPLGLYSETRYVGTLLPFYRAPYNFYQEGSFTSENINGLRVAHTFGANQPWSLEAQVFGGGLSMIESYFGEVNRAHSDAMGGGQLWLGTPVEGLRFGIGGDLFEVEDTILADDGQDQWKTWIASAELARTRYRLQSEYSQIRLRDAEVTVKAFYAYAGVNVTEKLVAHLQHDRSSVTLGREAPTTLEDFYTDTTLGISYAFLPSVVAKAEYHWAKGRLIEDQQVPLGPDFGPYRGNYFIVSLSASF